MTPVDEAPSIVEYRPWHGIWRSLRRRCPVCARRGISRHVASIEQTCPHCGLDLERQVGSFIGGVGLNTIVAFGCLLAIFIGGFVVTGGDGSITGVLLPAIAVSFIVPVVFYARSRLLWVALELRWWPLEPGEVDLDE